MAKKLISWKTKGMNRDTSVSAFNPEFAFENRNLRLSTNEGNTMMSWVNERGPKELILKIDVDTWLSDKEKSDSEVYAKYTSSIMGVAIGTAVINHKLVIFSCDRFATGNNSYIYVFEKSKNIDWDYSGKLLYRGTNLGFYEIYPIETLVSYESEKVQKVYWTDGLNQPRVINIAADDDIINSWKNSSIVPFDFVPELALKEEVSITKIFGSGEFPAGVIQYAFTYYNRYGQESNIFYTTPLQYISYVDRGGSPESKIANSFRIRVSGIDSNFDYLRIYSILRTSKDATPLVKRIQDIEIKGDTSITYIDDGIHGDTIDPTELLYKGGESIIANTMEQKDGTLFLGNIKTTKAPLVDIKKRLLSVTGASKESPLATDAIISKAVKRYFMLVSKEPFSYINTLSVLEDYKYSGAAGFKAREYYRLGLQFQYKNGKWSEPCWIGDKRQEACPTVNSDSTLEAKNVGTMSIPEFALTLYNTSSDGQEGIITSLYKAGYRKVRPVFAVPNLADRTILCQGIGCPTMYRKIDRYADAKVSKNQMSMWSGSKEGRLYAQSSWLFRMPNSIYSSATCGDGSNGGGRVCYDNKLQSQFDIQFILDNRQGNVVSPYLRCTEIMGVYDDGHVFYIDDKLATIHTPEVIFDESMYSMDFKGCAMKFVGTVGFDNTFGDVDIQTSTPAIGSDAAGFVHRSIVTDGGSALITAPFYNDYLVDDLNDEGTKFGPYNTSSPCIDFPVYLWQKNGSLNNDVARDARSAELLKKKISNYRQGSDITFDSTPTDYKVKDIQLFSSDELSVVKVDGHVYMGNIETLLTPTTPSPHYLIGNPWRDSVDTDFVTSDCYYKLGLKDPTNTDSQYGVWSLIKDGNKYKWEPPSGKDKDLGDHVKGLDQWREGVSMKYKSTPHIVVKIDAANTAIATSDGIFGPIITKNQQEKMPVVEISKPYDPSTFFGGTSDDVMKSLTWIPCGPPVSFDRTTSPLSVAFKWGDTYFQRFECLKTYPFTQEDKNQVVEIASFMCESRVNMDGRYDRNRMQTSNLNMTPQNFNLLNPVYSQMDNFFSYKMLDDREYDNVNYPNNITWTKTKENGADIDLWTNITLANTLELDGDKGEITKLTRLNNTLIAFQDKGISQILYNENTQISTTEGVPIEIANSQKVQGKRYLSDTVGCSNKWSIAQTPNGIYFMDSNDKSIYLFNGQLNNLSLAGGFNSWSKQYIPSADSKWTPVPYYAFSNFAAHYDKQNQDVLFINEDIALAYSEKFNCFTSFYDYGNTPYLDYVNDEGIWVRDGKLWKHQAGEYCNFFGENKPYSMTLIANQEPQMDKIFTNLEFRACVNDEGIYDESTEQFTPSLPFDSLEAWDEYQHGILSLSNKNKANKFTHGLLSGILSRKFRIWRCDIPRDNAPVDATTECPLGIKRFKARSLDRIRNTWAYLKLSKNAAAESSYLNKTEIHDIVATYFD